MDAGTLLDRSATTVWRRCTTGVGRRVDCAAPWPADKGQSKGGLGQQVYPYECVRACIRSIVSPTEGPLITCMCLPYCRGAAAAIIVYDITSTDSFNRAKAWVRELQRQGSPNMIMALAGGCAWVGGRQALLQSLPADPTQPSDNPGSWQLGLSLPVWVCSSKWHADLCSCCAHVLVSCTQATRQTWRVLVQ